MKALILTLFFLPLLSFAQPEVNSFPEPMVYDLMRGLDAKKYEFEINTLYFSNGNFSPEIEYAVKDGWAFELETPIKNGRIEALKWGTQYTLYQDGSKFLMGVQAIVEDHLYDVRNDYSLSAVIDYQLSIRWSLVSITGIRVATMDRRLDHNVGLINFSIFYNLNDRLFLGIENDKKVYFVDKEMNINTIPQISLKLTKKMRLQAGIGFNWQDSSQHQAIMRGIVEF